MNLLVDIGNQNVKWECGDQSGLFASQRNGLTQNIESQFNQLKNVSRVVFVNVAGEEFGGKLKNYASTKWGLDANEVTSVAEQCGVRNCYRNVEELGADRWAALIGAWSMKKQALIVIDCGTAITVDALSHEGEFIGGSILPGLSLARDSLSQRAPGIGHFSNLSPALPARSTVEAVSSGVVYAAVGGVDMLIQKYCNLIGGTQNLLLTGGTASLVREHSLHPFESVQNLTLIGLKVIAKTL